jgi:hypothetical protein
LRAERTYVFQVLAVVVLQQAVRVAEVPVAKRAVTDDALRGRLAGLERAFGLLGHVGGCG